MLRSRNPIGPAPSFPLSHQDIIELIKQRRQPRAEQRPCLDDTAASGKFRRIHHVLGPDFDIDAEMIADRHQPAPLLVGIVAPRFLLTPEPEIESPGSK